MVSNTTSDRSAQWESHLEQVLRDEIELAMAVDTAIGGLGYSDEDVEQGFLWTLSVIRNGETQFPSHPLMDDDLAVTADMSQHGMKALHQRLRGYWDSAFHDARVIARLIIMETDRYLEDDGDYE